MNYEYKKLDYKDPDVQRWIQKVESVAKKKSETEEDNIDPIFAGIVMENIYKESSKEKNGATIRIYATNMNGNISAYDNYLSALLNYVRASKSNILKVLIDELPDTSGDELNAFKLIQILLSDSKYKDQVELKIVKEEKKEELKVTLSKELGCACAHFAVSTQNMYRLETNPQNHQAKFCFNSPEKAIKLRELFDQLFNPNLGFSEPIPLEESISLN